MTIGILGCGWLGKSLAQLLMSKGHLVKGTTTSRSKLPLLAKEGIDPFLIQLPLDSKQETSAFWATEILVIAFPPGLRSGDEKDYISKIKSIEKKIKELELQKVLFVNSTSIYASDGKLKTEEDENQSSILFEAESTLANACKDRNVVFVSARCGGLMGYDRYPCKYYSTDKPITGATSQVNYIHRDDAVDIISQLIEKEETTEVYNLVCDEHPSRKDVLLDCFKQKKDSEPTFTQDTKAFKLIDNTKVKKVLSYSFKYKSPLDFKYTF